MAAEREPIEISNYPELVRLFEEMEATGEPCVLQRNGRDVAILRPADEDSRPQYGSTDEDDPLWEIVGIAQKYEDELDPYRPTDVSANKHKYLADAYADLHTRE